jgi:hypothetical protein
MGIDWTKICSPFFWEDQMAIDLLKLITEYHAIEKTDRLHKQAQCSNENEAIGFTVRTVRRQEILHELLTWIRSAENVLKNEHN